MPPGRRTVTTATKSSASSSSSSSSSASQGRSLAELNKLTVTALRTELEKLGLDSTGLKKALVERLAEAEVSQASSDSKSSPAEDEATVVDDEKEESPFDDLSSLDTTTDLTGTSTFSRVEQTPAGKSKTRLSSVAPTPAAAADATISDNDSEDDEFKEVQPASKKPRFSAEHEDAKAPASPSSSPSTQTQPTAAITSTASDQPPPRKKARLSSEADQDDEEDSLDAAATQMIAETQPTQRIAEPTAPTAPISAASAASSKKSAKNVPASPKAAAAPVAPPARAHVPSPVKPVEPQGPKPRLVMTGMEMENFKSYAGLQKVGPFHNKFTSIVGPNGSGKSNVIDGLLFVFGKRAKDLRHSKVSGLIHRSSDFPDLDYCRVEVAFEEVLDHDDGTIEVIPNSQFRIARVAYADTKKQPKYQLNGKSAKFDVIEALLESKGIGLHHNRFLILQGDVEQISMMKPKGTGGSDEGLLEYIEDVIGTDKYVEPIEEKRKELEAISEQRQHRVARLRVVDRELQAVTEPKRQGEELLLEEGRVIDARAQLAQLQQAHSRREEKTKVSELEAARAQLQKEQERATADRQRLQELEKQVEEAQELYNKADAAWLESKTQFAEQSREFTTLKQEKKNAKKDLQSLKQKVSREEQKASDMEKSAQEERDRLEQLQSTEIPKLEKAHATAEKELEKVYAGLRSQTESLQAELKAKQDELAPLAKLADDAAADAALKRSELDLAREEHETALKRLSEAEKLLEKCTTELPEKRTRLETIDSRSAEIQQSIPQLRSEIDGLRTQEQALQKDQSVISQALQRARAAAEDAGRALRDATATTSGGNSVSAKLLAAQKKGALSGIRGRLGDLASVPAHLDIAVSTAAASNLNSIVVDRVADAEKAVQYVRKNRLGVITCLIVEKQEKLRQEVQTQKFSCPPKSERLFDKLIMKDPALAGCFYFAFKNTLVCNNMDDAKHAAFGSSSRRRVVTTSGEIIEVSGTMSGGGRPIQGLIQLEGDNSARSQESQEQLEAEHERAKAELGDCEKRSSAISSDLQANSKQLASAVGELSTIETELSEIQSEATNLRMDLDTAGQREKEIRARLPALREACQQSSDEKAEIDRLEKALKQQVASEKKSKSEADVLKRECDELQSRIAAAGGDKVKEQKAVVENLAKQLTAAGKEKAKLAASAKSADKAQERATSAALKLREELTRAEKSLADLEDKTAAFLAQANETNIAQTALETGRQATSKELAKAQKRYRELKDVVDEFDKQQTDLQFREESLKDEATQAAAAIVHFERALQKFADQKKDCVVEVQIEAPVAPVAAPPAVSDDNAVAAVASKEVEMAELSKPTIQVFGPEAKLTMLSDAEVEEKLDGNYDKAIKTLHVEIAKHEDQLSRLGDRADAIRSIKRWCEIKREWEGKRDELEEITQQKNAIGQAYEDLRKRRLNEFMAGFEIICQQLKTMYRMITIGGDAELELVDNLNPFDEGIVFAVRPPKKSWKNIANLSGGEKTLSSLALVFALHYYKPTPLYVMDEIDAALDFKNVSIVANYIKERTKNAQFVIISLRNYMFELADRLVGVYKLSNCSRSVAITPAEFSIPALPASASSKARVVDKENEPDSQ